MKNHERLNKADQNGFVLIVCMIILLMLSLIGIASISNSNSDMTIAANEFNRTGSFYSAEAGLEKAVSEIRISYENTGAPPNPLPAGETSLGQYQNQYRVADMGPAVQSTLKNGAYAGLYGLIKEFQISSNGFVNSSESTVLLETEIQDALIPLFQFAVFYENDLEIAPGPNMTLEGRVHSNGDVYLQSGNNLYIDSYLTSAGNILHGRKPGGGNASNGNVYVLDGNGNYQNMRNVDGTFLDAESDDWVNLSLSRWGGSVEDGNHGITNLYMPVVSDGSSTDLIDRGDGNPDSFEHQAGLKFVDNQALYRQVDGTWLNVTAALTGSGAIQAGNFKDSREGIDVSSLDIDIAALSTSGYYPANGIVYASIQESVGSLTAVRLTNGSQLPSGLTVATNNPLYTQGDYNVVNKQPASLIADAITILSNNWDDTNSWGSLGGRIANTTRVNACYMTGNTETGSSGNGYCGGLENLPRFLEKWSGVTLTWRGSAVDLWYSRQAASPWSYGTYYKAPIRDWAFDPDLLDPNNLPPGTPQVNLILRTSWRQSIANEYRSPYSEDSPGNGNGNGNGA
ncbi:MAG: PilX N-terminal domain-containing pilus assembly protein [candidate division Zixibacteria bacterium]